MTEQDAYTMFHAILTVAIGLRKPDDGALFAGAVGISMTRKYPDIDFQRVFTEVLRDLKPKI